MRREVDEQFARYVRARQHHLLRAAFLVCGDVGLAEDVVEEALVDLALHWDRLRGQDPDAFVRRTLYRSAVASWRRRRREGLETIAAGPASPDAMPTAAGRVDGEQALLTLSPRQRAVVVLRWFDDRSEEETAEVLGTSVGTVRSEAGTAVERLGRVLPDRSRRRTIHARGDEP